MTDRPNETQLCTQGAGRCNHPQCRLAPHGPVDERFMRHHYGANGYVNPSKGNTMIQTPAPNAPCNTEEKTK